MADSREIDDQVDFEDDNYEEEEEEEEMDDDVDENNGDDDVSEEEDDRVLNVIGEENDHVDDDDDDVKPRGLGGDNNKGKHAELLALPPHGSEIFIGGLSREVVEEDLSELCEPFGDIVEVRLSYNYN